MAQAAEVEVDTETGHIHVKRFVSADDVGQAINPALVEGQVERRPSPLIASVPVAGQGERRPSLLVATVPAMEDGQKYTRDLSEELVGDHVATAG